jgi:hypothetical protein
MDGSRHRYYWNCDKLEGIQRCICLQDLEKMAGVVELDAKFQCSSMTEEGIDPLFEFIAGVRSEEQTLGFTLTEQEDKKRAGC